MRIPSFPFRQLLQWVLTWRFLARSKLTFDLVHCHCISPTSLAALQFYRRKGVPVLLQPSLGGAGGEFERAHFFRIRRPIDKMIRSADAYAVLNADIHRDLENLGIDKNRFFAIRNGIDLHKFKVVSKSRKAALRQQLRLPPGLIVLYVGQFIERKGVSELLDVWADVRTDIPSANLLFVGAGPLTKRIILASRRDESIYCLGERRDVHRLMQAADFFVFPSSNESFGCVLVEAMASGLPLIAGNTGIAATLPIDRRVGRVINPGDRNSLKYALLELAADPELRASYGDQGPRLAECYDIQNVAEDVIGIYRSMIV